MLDRIGQDALGWWEAIVQALLFSVIGILTAVGQLLASKEVLTKRIILGRCLSTVGIAVASGILLIPFPNIPPLAQIGAAAALASLGTSGLERLIQRVLGVRQEG